MTGRSRVRGVAAAVVLGVLLAACSPGAGSAPSSSTPVGAGDGLTGTLTVLAAASLQGAFDDLATAFEAQHPDVDVRPVTYDGSSTLATQLVHGASGDVFASADEATMSTVVDAGLVDGDPVVFTTNTLEIVVEAGNPRGVRALADLAALPDGDGKVVVCAAQVPCGSATQRALAAAGVTLTPASEEQNVSAVLTKVALGEADAGVVYRTDVQAAGGDVEGVPFDEAAQVVNRYPLAVLAAGTRQAQDPAVARAFVDLVLSPTGQEILAARGFVAP